MSLGAFKNFSADRMDLEELVALSAFGKSLKAEFVALGVDTPEFVDANLRTLKREVASRIADKREAEVRRVRAQLEALKTPGEKKKELQAQLEALENQLAGA